MSRRPIGYYVHHQGAGHWQRANLIAEALDRPVTLIGTLADLDTRGARAPTLDLPDDRLLARFDGRDGASARPEAFHYAPVGADNVRARMGRLAAWIVEADPALIVVDVSVEIALFARLMSVPTLVVRLSGNRTDTPHCEAFRSAEAVLAFFSPELEAAGTPDWVRAKTLYAGMLAPGTVATPVSDDGSIVVVYGRGGEGGRITDLADAARAVPERHWHVLGPVEGVAADLPANLTLYGWVADPAAFLARAALVVGAGGDGVVSTVAALAKRFLCLPEPRAFDEQVAKAEALAAMAAAIHCPAWPRGSEWPALIAAGLRLDPARIGALAEPGAVARAARLIGDVADRAEARRA
ncbi:glycosyltransferase [Methylobacterium sp. J-068]|uniref:glycosyltransferase n=1 Tax=Methylobacterium sp. J-068 TaxID=2836649 RepID=UPI001FBAF19C|nr:glycosyltransferase [Methylobacterium sp. J-068]MCJ2033078.1 glycosyltransferase [Methylobacterium sp. J-068]